MLMKRMRDDVDKRNECDDGRKRTIGGKLRDMQGLVLAV
jgi:hypothetical protein